MESFKNGNRTIRCNRYDNWYGYVSGRRVLTFWNSKTQTMEDAAREWLETGIVPESQPQQDSK